MSPSLPPDPLGRARHVTRQYRGHLQRVDPHLCARVDALVRGWGETWATGVTDHQEPVVDSTEAARLLGVTTRAVRLAVQRGTLATVGKDDAGWLFTRTEIDRYATTRSRSVATPGSSAVPSNASG